MTVEEIFNKIASHMKEGICYHEKMAQAYNFLGLYGSAKCQFSHHREEFEAYQHLLNYYATHYHKLLQPTYTIPTSIIPEAWYKYTTFAVDTSTRTTAIKELMNKWIEWERSTKKLYQEMRQELTTINDLAAALYIDNLILDVTKELSHAEKKLIKLEIINYDMTGIQDIENEMEQKYTKKLRW